MSGGQVPEAGLNEVVDCYWPYDGPHTPEKVQAAAVAVSGLVRYLNNATFSGGAALPYASSVHGVLSSLEEAVSRLPQLLDQLGKVIAEQAGDPALYDDRRDRPGAETAAELQRRVVWARNEAALFGRTLGDALSLSVHLGNEETGTDEAGGR